MILKQLVVFLCCVALVSCNKSAPGKMAEAQKKQAPAIEGFVVRSAHLDNSITVSGTLKPLEETVLMPEISGRVVATFPKESVLKRANCS